MRSAPGSSPVATQERFASRPSSLVTGGKRVSDGSISATYTSTRPTTARSTETPRERPRGREEGAIEVEATGAGREGAGGRGSVCKSAASIADGPGSLAPVGATRI